MRSTRLLFESDRAQGRDRDRCRRIITNGCGRCRHKSKQGKCISSNLGRRAMNYAHLTRVGHMLGCPPATDQCPCSFSTTLRGAKERQHEGQSKCSGVRYDTTIQGLSRDDTRAVTQAPPVNTPGQRKISRLQSWSRGAHVTRCQGEVHGGGVPGEHLKPVGERR